MPNLSVKLPLTIDNIDGFYRMNKSLSEVAKQDLKMLILTNPGERILKPNFGVGLRQYLFESSEIVKYQQQEIVTKIEQQVSEYMPFIQIKNVFFGYDESDNPHLMYVRISYVIIPLNFSDTLEVSESKNSSLSRF